MVNKRGWLRILEATIAILLISTVLVTVYSRQISKPDTSEYIYNLQMQVLKEISLRSDLRFAALNGSAEALVFLNEFVTQKVPTSYNFTLLVCDLGTVCELDEGVLISTLRDSIDVYAEEKIISAVVSTAGQTYSPKVVKIFIWEVR